MRREIAQTIGPRNRYVASRLGNWYSRLIQEGPGVFTPYRREVEREEGNKQNTPARSLLPELPDTVSEDEIKKWLHGRESLVELFGLDPEQVKDIPKEKLDALLVQILNVRPQKKNGFQGIVYKEAVKKKIYDTFSLRNPNLEARLFEGLKYVEMDPNWMNYRYLSVEDLKKERERIKQMEPYLETMDFAPFPASVIMSRGSKNQQKTLNDEFKRRGVLPGWL